VKDKVWEARGGVVKVKYEEFKQILKQLLLRRSERIRNFEKELERKKRAVLEWTEHYGGLKVLHSLIAEVTVEKNRKCILFMWSALPVPVGVKLRRR